MAPATGPLTSTAAGRPAAPLLRIGHTAAEDLRERGPKPAFCPQLGLTPYPPGGSVTALSAGAASAAAFGVSDRKKEDCQFQYMEERADEESPAKRLPEFNLV